MNPAVRLHYIPSQVCGYVNVPGTTTDTFIYHVSGEKSWRLCVPAPSEPRTPYGDR